MTLKRAYEEIMERIEVMPELRARILTRLRSAEPGPARKKSPAVSRRFLAAAACLALLLTGAVLPRLLRPDRSGVLAGAEIERCESAAALSQRLGFPLADVETLPFRAEETAYTAYWGQLGEITYRAGEETAVYRKSVGTADNSGDYTVYETETELETAGITATLKGGGDLYGLAIWSDGTYAYSLSLSTPRSADVWSDLLGGAF